MWMDLPVVGHRAMEWVLRSMVPDHGGARYSEALARLGDGLGPSSLIEIV